jgi:hypothetical protein
MATARTTGITDVTNPEPSDASEYKPVNRIALLTKYGLFEAVGIPPRKGPVGAAGRVINLDEPEGMTDIVPALTRTTRDEFDLPSVTRADIYRMTYDAVLRKLAEGRSPEEVRAFFLEGAAAYERESQADDMGATVEGIREAVQDALAGRPSRYESPDGE